MRARGADSAHGKPRVTVLKNGAACIAVAALFFTAAVQAADNAAQVAAMKVHTDRMSILMQEREDIVRRLHKAEEDKDQSGIAQGNTNLQIIDREIASVSRQPVYPTKATWPAQGPAAKPASAAPVAVTESLPDERKFEGWDVFKNFGK